jgi:hypothetical protein
MVVCTSVQWDDWNAGCREMEGNHVCITRHNGTFMVKDKGETEAKKRK